MNIYEKNEIPKVSADNSYGMTPSGHRTLLDIPKLRVSMAWRYNKNKEING